MRQLALALSFLSLAACTNFTWKGHNADLTPEQKQAGLQDVAALSSKYEAAHFFGDVRRRSDGRNNAFGRDMLKIVDFVDRHFWNYDAEDPYVNYPSDTTWFEHLGRFTLYEATSVPGVDGLSKK